MNKAMTKTEFYNEVVPVIVELAKKNGYHVASPIIAQAICESNTGKSSLAYKHYNFFGMKAGSKWKGKVVNMKTKEEYTKGTLTTITDGFRSYSSVREGIQGYFDFINTKRYANLKTAKTPKEYLEMIKADGYATSSKYVNTNMNIIEKNGLAKYDEEFVTGEVIEKKNPENSGEISKEIPVTVNIITPQKTVKEYRVKTNGGNLNIRQLPSDKSSIIGKLRNKSTVKVIGKQGDWYKIEHNGTNGFVFSKYVIEV